MKPYSFAPATPRQRGFTLVEISIVLLVVGLLLGAILTPLATQLRVRESRNAQKQIKEVRQALIGFAQTQGRLPCPDTNRDGIEEYTPAVPPVPGPAADATCTIPAGTTAYIGFLPYATIGLTATDPWGRLFTYRVAPEFINLPVPGALCGGAADGQLGICDTGNITVFTRGDNPGTAGIQIKNPNNYVTNAAAVIVSFGSNGYCGTIPDGIQMAPATGACPAIGVTTTDESENSNRDGIFVSRNYTGKGGACSDTVETSIFCEFDDLVEWIPTSLLMGKLIEAGQLP